MKEKMITLFVYGTLKSHGLNNSWLVKEGLFLGSAWVYGELYVDFLPYLFEGKDEIKGELYKVPKAVYQSIYNMEIGAGYYVKKIKAHMLDKNVIAKVFLHTGKYVNKKTARRVREY